MSEKVPIIKNRDRSDYRFDTHKRIDLAGANYLTDNDDISVIFFGPITLLKVTVAGGSVVEQSNASVRLPTLPRRARLRNFFCRVTSLKLAKKVCKLFSRILARRGEKRREEEERMCGRGRSPGDARRRQFDNYRDGRFDTAN